MRPGRAIRDHQGFSLLEVMIATILLVIVFLGLAQYYYRGRVQMDYEEDRRKATAVAQKRLDGIRRDYKYDELHELNGGVVRDTSDNRIYTITHTVAVDSPEDKAATVTLRVDWNAKVGGNVVQRSLNTTTILGRAVGVQQP